MIISKETAKYLGQFLYLYLQLDIFLLYRTQQLFLITIISISNFSTFFLLLGETDIGITFIFSFLFSFKLNKVGFGSPILSLVLKKF